MAPLEAKHYAVLAALLVALGTQLAGLEHGWVDASSPAFLGGLLIQIGTTIAALFVGPPRDPERRTRLSDTPTPPTQPVP